MAEIGDKVFTTDMIQLIKDAVKAELGTNAYVNRYLAEVTAVDTTTSAVSVKLSGSDSVSDSFRARGIQLPSVGEQVVACIDGQDRWIESVIRPVTSTPYVTFATAAAVPTGAIVAWLTTTAPTGWLFCNGATYAYNTYPALGELRGGTAGGNFTVPDLRDRFMAGNASVASAWSNNSGTFAPNTALATHTHDTDITHGHANTIAYASATQSGTVAIAGGVTSSTATSGSPSVAGAGASGSGISYATGGHTHSIAHGHGDTFSASFTGSSHSHTKSGAVTDLGSTLVTSDTDSFTPAEATAKSALLNFIIKT
jgi:microcystin-dependent protein